jgi:hypothetical protein
MFVAAFRVCSLTTMLEQARQMRDYNIRKLKAVATAAAQMQVSTELLLTLQLI